MRKKPMDKSEPPGLPGLAPAWFPRRALARLLDLTVGLSPLLLLPRGHRRAGLLIAAALLLTSDSLFGPGRSLGKRLLGLRTLVVRTQRPAGVRQSMARNLVFALALVPTTDALLTLGALAVVCALEALVALQPLTRDLGQRRLGDLLAGTQVVDASLALRLPHAVPSLLESPRPAPLASRAARSRLQKRKTAACASP
jgi:uncharacterized RDD family membrane protein YckC